jgi:putative phosphoesterase
MNAEDSAKLKNLKDMDKRLIGVISDTHGLIRPEVYEAIKKSELIIHAGDIGNQQVLDKLRNIAPVVAVRGNTDRGDWMKDLPYFEIVEVDQRLIYVTHNLHEIDLDPGTSGISAVIFGHSHQPSIRFEKDILFLNPGSAGPRRFHLPVSVALIRLTDHGFNPELIELG